MMSDADKVWTPSEIRLRYERGERNFRGLDIDDTGDSSSFREAVLDDADFTQCFVVADFSRASLRGCRFTQSNVKTCEFDNADLPGLVGALAGGFRWLKTRQRCGGDLSG